MSDLIPRHMAVAACAIGPSDEWSKATRSGYERAALDCTMNILRIESELPHPIAALAMRERAAKMVVGDCGDASVNDMLLAEAIRAMPTTFTDAELLAAAMQLPEVRALIEAADDLLNAITVENQFGDRSLTITGHTANLKWLIGAEDDTLAALAPFMKGGE